jgi:tRNA 2-thiocytidine biosynthesis protein TtcA
VRDGVLHGCDVCSRHRRRALYRVAGEIGAHAIALGHTADDCAESLFRNVLFNGRIASLPPVATSRKGTLRLIRPLVYVTEAMTTAYVAERGLGTVGCVCGEKPSVRGDIRSFLAAMRERHPGTSESITAALANVNPYTLFDRELSKVGADVPPDLDDAREA